MLGFFDALDGVDAHVVDWFWLLQKWEMMILVHCEAAVSVLQGCN